MVDWSYGVLLLFAKSPGPPGRWRKHLLKGDLENHVEAGLLRLAPWQNTIQFLRKASKDSNLARKCYLEKFLWTCIVCGEKK